MTARDAFAHAYHAQLLARLEQEEADGWPDLPWPAVPAAAQIARLERLVGLLATLLTTEQSSTGGCG